MDSQRAMETADALVRTCLAKGLIAGDTSVAGIARYARVHAAEAERVVLAAREQGLMDDDGNVDVAVRTRLIADVPIEEVVEVHAAVARHLMAGGPTQLLDAVNHARAAGSLVPLDELVAMADRGGMMSLSLNDYQAAHDLLSLAVDFDSTGSDTVRGRRLCELATAADGLGRVDEARSLLAKAAALGEVAGDPSLIARAAVQYALPIDWFAGDLRASALLQRAEAVPLTLGEQVMVKAARALVEARIPVDPRDGQQVAWITRTDVAHRLADEALAESDGQDLAVRGFAALAWRTVHRSPALLASRREMATRALNIAQQLRQPANQIEASVWLAADALESGDRPLFDEALSVLRWVAERDGNPRLKWRAFTLATGAAHLDGNLAEAERFRILATETANSIKLPGGLGGELLALGQEVVARDDLSEMKSYILPEDHPAYVSPLGKSIIAKFHARLGNFAAAGGLIQRAMRQLDMESSYLLLATRCADAALLLDDADLVDNLIGVLSEWHDHVSVDSNGWWCDGPVSVWLAQLHASRGEVQVAAEYLAEGEPVARALNDVRSLKRVAQLRVSLRVGRADGSSSTVVPLRLVPPDLLTEREQMVMSLLALGSTNREIAAALSFSVGTIRADTMSIYRKLDVNGRVEAVARAIALGLVKPTA